MARKTKRKTTAKPTVRKPRTAARKPAGAKPSRGKTSGWVRKTSRDREAIVVSDALVTFVPVRGGTALRTFATPKEAIAAGFGAALVRMMFRRDEPKGACDGVCDVVFSDDKKWVWCKSRSCRPETDCECRLREMWQDQNGPHDEDRGAPGPDYKYPRRAGSFWRCICKPLPKTEPVPDPGDIT